MALCSSWEQVSLLWLEAQLRDVVLVHSNLPRHCTFQLGLGRCGADLQVCGDGQYSVRNSFIAARGYLGNQITKRILHPVGNKRRFVFCRSHYLSTLCVRGLMALRMRASCSVQCNMFMLCYTGLRVFPFFIHP